MHPSKTQLVRRTQYPRLQDDPSVGLHPEIVGMRRRLFWIHHEKPEDSRNGQEWNSSRSNAYEVEMVACLVKHLASQGVYSPTDIAVITPYLGQLRCLRNKFAKSHTILLNERDVAELENDELQVDTNAGHANVPEPAHTKATLNQAIRLATVDNFQGEEAKVIIVSLVRSNPDGSVGFLKTPNRINVLLSRAQHGMYIIGNSETACSVPMWQEVVQIFRDGCNIDTALELCCPRHPLTPITVEAPEDFARLAPEAGCDLTCDRQLECGHACIAKCHSNLLHNAVHCMKACTRLKTGCNHLCEKPCGQQCDRVCKYVLTSTVLELPCGHAKDTIPCYQYQNPALIRCNEVVHRTVPGCNHVLPTACHVDVTLDSFQCTAPCEQDLPCGHKCLRKCYECQQRSDGSVVKIDHGACLQRCGRNHTTCQHRCNAECHAASPCPLCTVPCESSCAHARCSKQCYEPCTPCSEAECGNGWLCSHTESGGCTMPCAAPCDYLPCITRCDELLSCGCRCPSVCGERCPDAKFCQTRGSDAIRNIQADLLMLTTYGEVDLDADPCIFTPCGHIFTVDSLDGTMSMTDFYEIDAATGRYTGIKSSVEPFSMKESKPCPECRASLRGVARYGRLVKRAALDESAKKLIDWAKYKHQGLVIRLEEFQADLVKTVDSLRKPTQTVRLNGTIDAQLVNVAKLQTRSRYGKLLGVVAGIRQYVKRLQDEEQPYRRVHDLVEVARQQKTISGDIAQFVSEELQPRERLQAACLYIHSYLVLVNDVLAVHDKTPVGIAGKLRIDLSDARTQCELLSTEAGSSSNHRLEAEAYILWARSAAMECGINESKADTWHRVNVEELSESATLRLRAAEDICNAQTSIHQRNMQRLQQERPDLGGQTIPSWIASVQAQALKVRRMLREKLSNAEMSMVYEAMKRDIGNSAGHWYRCANGHPFTVGECGLPMQLARCPECGAGIGGTSHKPTDGVSRANDIDQMFARMTT